MEHHVEIPIEVITVPLVIESLDAQQPTLAEIPSTEQEQEVQAADPGQTPETASSPPDEVTESTPPAVTSDNGPTETVQAAPPPTEEPAEEAPAPTISPEAPPALQQAKPLEQPKPPAPPKPTVPRPKSEPRPPEAQRKTAALPPEETTRRRARERQRAGSEGRAGQQQQSRQAALPSAKSDPRAQASYMSGVTSRLLARRYFPTGAPSGSVVVNFSVSSSGKLMSRRVVRSSGSSILDRAALNIVDRAAPFPPFPKSVTAPHLNFNVPMSFSR
ncbi:energy transducer TonB family protein [Pseudaminobacter soli (ex Li et al. 2025)]|uniref:energy transducer TonB family protein n=1 Tax=Pseudaminobacter soli (ex Li et al. 2025) TaxID=1295366 RepID=UPI002476EE51|nr:energy transducer TonB [Mesorhizobium soli]